MAEIFFPGLPYYEASEVWAMVRTILLISIPLTVIQLVLMIAAIVSLVRKPNLPSNDKILWVLIIVLINLIGPIIYFAIGSNHLDEKLAKLEDEREANRQ